MYQLSRTKGVEKSNEYLKNRKTEFFNCAILQIAKIQANLGQPWDASKTIKFIKNQDIMIEALADIGKAWASAGNIKNAQLTFIKALSINSLPYDLKLTRKVKFIVRIDILAEKAFELLVKLVAKLSLLFESVPTSTSDDIGFSKSILAKSMQVEMDTGKPPNKYLIKRIVETQIIFGEFESAVQTVTRFHGKVGDFRSVLDSQFVVEILRGCCL